LLPLPPSHHPPLSLLLPLLFWLTTLYCIGVGVSFWYWGWLLQPLTLDLLLDPVLGLALRWPLLLLERWVE
jgi:hypothetical protein